VAVILSAAATATAGEWVDPDGSDPGGPGAGQLEQHALPPAEEGSDFGDLADHEEAAGKRGSRHEARPRPFLAPGEEPSRYVLDSIPPGHLPPPGTCRLWYADRPPGHQPPPGPCAELRGKPTARAFLVEG
jgi:hypothetical protein